MTLSDFTLNDFDSLEEAANEIAHKINITGGDQLNVLRYQIFTHWHDEVGLSWEDKEYIRACGFDVDAFLSDAELNEVQKNVYEEAVNYRKEREQKSLDIEKYISKNAKAIKKEAKKLKKVKGSKLTSEDLVDISKAKHIKESEICTAIATADKTLTRRLERLFLQQHVEGSHENEEDAEAEPLSDDSYRELKDAFIQKNKTADKLVKEVIRNDGETFNKDELRSRAEEYLENGGLDARITLLTSEEEFVEKANAYLAERQKKIFLWTLFGLTITNLILLIARYAVCIVTLDRTVISTNPLYMFGSSILSIVTWILLTSQDYFNFYNRKWKMLIVVCINISATFIQTLYTATWDHVVVYIFKIKTNDLFTANMVLTLARISVVASLVLGGVIAYKMIAPFICAAEVKDKILAFKITHVVDNRENKQYMYDFVVVRDLKTGTVILVKMQDLFTHLLMIGASGTGKTSSVYLPQIIINIERKIKNLDLQQQEVLKMVQAGDVEVIKPFKNGRFNKKDFRVLNKSKQKEFEEIFKKYEDCGITVVAPNPDLNEDILTYASGRGIWVYNIDPTKKKATHPYEKLVGINVFYMPPEFHDIQVGDTDAEEERNIYIAEVAANFADTLNAINEMHGTGDQYFTDVNTTVTIHVTTVLMLDASIRGVQITVEDVYNCIVDFALLTPAVNNIKNHFDIKYQAEVEDKSKGRGAGRAGRERMNELRGLSQEDEEENNITDQQHVLTEADRKNPYLQTIITVESRLRKDSKMDEHAEGLRNLLGKLLQNPRVKRVLVTNKEIVDFNSILADNAITLVNTALSMDKTASTCFGQLFILSFNTAVLRRPKDTRTPHFFYEDETARYLSDTIDTMVTLYRQYRVACMFALQSLEQVDANKKLGYLKNVLLSAGSIITFGRASYQDAKQISELAGQVQYLMEQNTVSKTPLTAANASSSFSTRTTPDQKNYLEPDDIRARDFQECTIITTDGGRVMPGRLGKVNFVPKEIIDKVSNAQIERREMWRTVWRMHYPPLGDVMTPTIENTSTTDAMQQAAKELRQRSSQSVLIERSPTEQRIFASQLQKKEPQKMAAILNAAGSYYENVSETNLKGQVEVDEDWKDADFIVEDDDDFTFAGAGENENISVTVSQQGK